MKKITISSLDKKLWKIFSEYIRKRDCLNTTGSIEKGKCITCDQTIDYKKLQAGHYIPRQYKSTRYDENNNHAQCWACNCLMGGQGAIYGEKIKDLYGEKERQRLIESQYSDMKGGYQKKSLDWYREKIEEYKIKIESFESPKPKVTIDDLDCLF